MRSPRGGARRSLSLSTVHTDVALFGDEDHGGMAADFTVIDKDFVETVVMTRNPTEHESTLIHQTPP